MTEENINCNNEQPEQTFIAEMPATNEQVAVKHTEAQPNYGLVRIEAIRAALVGIAIAGAIFLGIRYPEHYAQAVSVTLSAVTGGYFGLAQQRGDR